MRKATFAALFAGLLACSPAGAQSSVLGFELSSDWSSTQTSVVGSEAYRTQGLRSLEVRVSGYTEVVSRPFSMVGVGSIGNKMWLEVRIPSPQSNPYWFGSVALYASVPSRGIYDTYLGQAGLEKCTFQGFCALEYTLTGPVAEAFRSGAPDARIRIGLNVAGQSSPYYLDNLRFGAEPPAPTPPAVPPGDLFGFEKDGDWSSPQSNVRANTTTKTEGARALEIRAGGYTEIVSRPFSTEKITNVSTKMRFDLLLPTPQSNPFWFGALQLYLSAPSKGVNSAYVGQISLDGLPLNTFNALAIDLPQWAQDLFKTPTYDLQVKFGLNVAPQTNPYVFDNIRVSDAPQPPRALILVDPRLKSGLATELETYRSLAEARRGFRIAIDAPEGLDDKTPEQVRAYLQQLRSANPGLEGVLFVGNVKMPILQMPRNEAQGFSEYTSYFPGYYEDLDAQFIKTYSDPGYWHDFDVIEKGASSPGLELWTSYMPVGETAEVDYAAWTNGLRSYLAKVIRSYQTPLATNGRWYGISHKIGVDFNLVWDAYTPGRIELIGVPTQQYMLPWDLSKYATYSAFRTAYGDLDLDNTGGWVYPSIGEEHMNDPTRNVDIVHYNMGRNTGATYNVIWGDRGKTITVGAPLVIMEGRQPAAYRIPGDARMLLAPDVTYPFHECIATSFLYGTSRATAVVANTAYPIDKTWDRRMGRLVQEYKTNRKYIAAANKARLDLIQAAAASRSTQLKMVASEMLLGDPFLDVR